MAYRAEALDITIDASGNKTISLSDFGGDTPKFVMAQSTKSTSDGNYQDDLFHSFGWGNLSQEDSAQMASVDNVGTSEVIRSIQDNLFTAFDPSGQQALDGGTSVAAGNPCTVNLALHGYSTGDLVAISGVTLGGDINGVHTITKIDDDSFSIPVNNPTNRTGGKALLVTDQITLVSFSADEVVINVGIYGGTPYTVLFMVLGGSTLTDVKVTSFNLVTSAEDVTNSTIAFVDGGVGADTITISGGDWTSLFFAGDVIEVSGSASNDGFYTIVSVTATVITLATGVLTDESAGPSVQIKSGFIDVTGLGFDDLDAAIMFSPNNDNGNNDPPFVALNSRETAFSFGFFDVANGSQCTESHIYSDDNVATMNTHSVAGSDANCWSSFSLKSGVWTLRGELSFVSKITDGFRLQQATGLTVPVSAHRIALVALKGGNYECVEKTAPSSPGTQDIVNSGFTPSGVMSLFGVALVPAMSIGWASNKDGTKANTKEGVALVSDLDAAATSDAKRLTKTDAFLFHDIAGPTSLDSVANVETWNSDGATLDFTAAFAHVYHVIFFGDGTVTPTASIPIQVMVY